jgi:hypothetical protein
MKLMTWAVGSVLISLVLVLAIGAVVSAAPPAGAAELPGCPRARAAAHAGQKLVHPATAASGRHSYLVATRMGWAIS